MSEELDRRQLLRAGVAGLAAGTTGLSGCGFLSSGDDTGTDTPGFGETPRPTTTSTPARTTTATTTSGQAGERITAASSALVANNDAFASFADQVSATDRSQPTSFAAATVRERVTTAETALSEAAGAASDEQLATIEAMRNLAATQRPAAGFFAQYATVVRQYNQVDQLNDSAQYGQALTQLDTVDQSIAGGRDPLANTESALEFVQADQLGSVAVELARFREAFETVRNWYDIYDAVVDALYPFLRGFEHYQRATTAYENEQFATAISAFEAAEADFGTANERFRQLSLDAVAADTPPGFDADPEQIECATDALGTAADFFRQSAQAFNRGETTAAQRLAQQGQMAVEECQLSG